MERRRGETGAGLDTERKARSRALWKDDVAERVQGLKHHKEAVEDLQRALQIAPQDPEVRSQLVAAQKDLEEHQKEKQVRKMLEDLQQEGVQEPSNAVGGSAGSLLEVRDLIQSLTGVQ